MHRIPRDLIVCLGFYTRLPMPRLEWSAGDFARASWASPLAGAVVGACGALAYAVGFWAGLPAMPAAALALAATMLASGALHEDGLADTADGFGGGATPERRLEIMRDSRIGTFGACALLLSVLLRWSALAVLSQPATVAWALVAAHAAARAPIPAFMRWTRPARPGGLAVQAGLPPTMVVAVAAVIGASCLSLLGAVPALLAALLLLFWFLLLRRLTLRQVGGQTGDVLGCLEQGGEIAVLLAIVATTGA